MTRTSGTRTVDGHSLLAVAGSRSQKIPKPESGLLPTLDWGCLYSTQIKIIPHSSLYQGQAMLVPTILDRYYTLYRLHILYNGSRTPKCICAFFTRPTSLDVIFAQSSQVLSTDRYQYKLVRPTEGKSENCKNKIACL